MPMCLVTGAPIFKRRTSIRSPPSVRFLQGDANSAVCSATRTGLITGRDQYRLRVGLEERLPAGRDDIGLPPEHPTLPSLLKKTGSWPFTGRKTELLKGAYACPRSSPGPRIPKCLSGGLLNHMNQL
jgi:hypothetical protein